MPGAELVYFVARTILWRCPLRNSPRNDSLAPLVYKLAVSMKLPPASRKALYTFCASSLAAPQPQSSPKVIVPSAASDTRRPEFPSSLYFIFFSLFNCRLTLRCPLTFPSCRQRRRRQRYARWLGRLPLTFASFLLSSLLRFLAVFHSVTMPNYF